MNSKDFVQENVTMLMHFMGKVTFYFKDFLLG